MTKKKITAIDAVLRLKRAELRPAPPTEKRTGFGAIIEQWEDEIERGEIVDANGVPVVTVNQADPPAK